MSAFQFGGYVKQITLYVLDAMKCFQLICTQGRTIMKRNESTHAHTHAGTQTRQNGEFIGVLPLATMRRSSAGTATVRECFRPAHRSAA